MTIQRKILFGYIILLTVITSMVVILVHERIRVMEIRTEAEDIRHVRRNISAIHRHITQLALLGEGVISWNVTDYRHYQEQRLHTDSLLQTLKPHCTTYVHPMQIDTLRSLLADKENHLLRLMETMEQQGTADSLLINHLPEVARRATHIRTVKQKKSGLAGVFGGKKTVQILPSAKELHQFSDSLIALQQQQTAEMDAYADSLSTRNRILNIQLNRLINDLDIQSQAAFAEKERKIVEAQSLSIRMFSVVTVSTVVLLLISFLVIRSDLRKEDKIKSKLEQVICENEELLEMRKRIILTVSHDIRGPLGNIHNCADLASDTRDKKKRETYLEDIRHSCHHILHLTNDLMDAYRLNEAGDLRNDTPFHLERFLQRISEEFSRKANTKALIFYPVLENTALTVKGDADKLEQVLANLLTNAIKFTSSGSISFHSKYFSGKLQIEIRDTGIGMDKETLKKVFAPFERAAQNVNSEGFGLGLFLTKGLVKVLDGTMNVESKPGKGSVFRLEFPLPETNELLDEEQPDSNPITVLPKKVLVVDDDPIQLKIAEDMLGRKGIACTTCMNVKEVVLALEQSDYDIVLTDVQMPENDGFALLKLLRNSNIGNSRTVPVAVMTARGDGNSGIYEKEGFSGCLHKPFNIHGLLSFLSSVISQTRTTNVGCFDFSYILENTDDSGHMLSLVIKESEKELEELEAAIKANDHEDMRKTIHRMMPVWEMLGKGYILRKFQTILHGKDSKDEIIHENATRITEMLRNLMEETRNELKKHEDINC
ncbi:Hpt sensor hybrid histidine kinase [Phocaeicola salanitronis DSM 18170]|uniref:histidine kinase n=1 Tax=Phocaeicola salanitronis (strain DSM 18170 / JCM 13657 / CCUG 60908 / BL78) TaxID=667015 RepID=F0R3Q4_PHOSB|nr:Hpt sensor hybrid histidine kinase [Phocaeicola salanitronis DSM 18170]